MKNYKELIKFLKDKYNSLLDKELKIPFSKILTEKNSLYKKTHEIIDGKLNGTPTMVLMISGVS